MKYLIIRFGAIGDVIHSTIIAQAIKNKYKEAEIHFLTSPVMEQLLKNSPYIDRIFTGNAKSLLNLIKLSFTILRKEKYDVIFSLSNNLKSMIMCKIASPKQVVKRSKQRVHAVDAFYNSALVVHNDLEKPKQLKLVMNSEITKKIEDKLKDYPRPYIVLAPAGAHNQIRQGRVWDIDYWKQLAKNLHEKYNGTIFVTGSKNEINEHKTLSEIQNVRVLTGELTLEESASLYEQSDLIITVDSGPLHIASCFDTKIIALLGSTSPDVVQPYGHKDSYIEPDFDCKYCWKKVCDKLKEGESITPCMKSIKPDKILDFIEQHNLL